MSINAQYNLAVVSALYLLFTNACRSALSSLANIPQRIREIGANLYNRMSSSTPTQSEPISNPTVVAEPPPTPEEASAPKEHEKPKTIVMNPAAVKDLRKFLLSNRDGNIATLLSSIYEPSDSVTGEDEIESDDETELLNTEGAKLDVDVSSPVPNNGQDSLLPTDEQIELLSMTPKAVKVRKTKSVSKTKPPVNQPSRETTVCFMDKEDRRLNLHLKVRKMQFQKLPHASFEFRNGHLEKPLTIKEDYR